MQFSRFPDLPGSAEAQVILYGIVKCLLIAYFTGNISAKKNQNPFTWVKVIASQKWDVFGTRYIWHTLQDKHIGYRLRFYIQLDENRSFRRCSF